ncbi:putative Sporulation-specific N-acetylmuramoyl-L-alanine amidase [Blattamonas nauphoetae]|uniref:Sporulation-specific N-acetylmuramoyl-L-alanine amidase n=1 Tax=Blattamonas nauphoetae TaxID=2049346 RepID=A0ABQ9XHM7_9EUKA|nr:putative Sporulation-specific N-acetylmuramoyl-L-alanine amidase [Blattamonas nauphoetae]
MLLLLSSLILPNLNAQPRKIYLDPYLGGAFKGACSEGSCESEIAWKLANRIGNILTTEYKDVEVLLSHEKVFFTKESDRKAKANEWGADLYLLIKTNAGGKTGFETVIHETADTTTTQYQETLHKKVLEQFANKQRSKPITDRGMQMFPVLELEGLNMPAIASYNMFIDEKTDRTFLNTDANISQLARGHANGIVAIFSLERKREDTNILFVINSPEYATMDEAITDITSLKEKGLPGNVFFEGNVIKIRYGHFHSEEKADDLMKKLEAAGLHPTKRKLVAP